MLKQKLEAELREIYVKGRAAVFQDDSAYRHVSKFMKKYFKCKNISDLDWSGNSPDLNPIENVSGIVKITLRKTDCTTNTKLIETATQIWFWDQQISENSKKTVDSMPKRVERIIKAKEGYVSL